jgi:hypothetical protein
MFRTLTRGLQARRDERRSDRIRKKSTQSTIVGGMTAGKTAGSRHVMTMQLSKLRAMVEKAETDLSESGRALLVEATSTANLQRPFVMVLPEPGAHIGKTFGESPDWRVVVLSQDDFQTLAGGPSTIDIGLPVPLILHIKAYLDELDGVHDLDSRIESKKGLLA